MDEKEALMTATFFSWRYGSSPLSVLSARLLWQYDRTASTVPIGTLQGAASIKWLCACKLADAVLGNLASCVPVAVLPVLRVDLSAGTAAFTGYLGVVEVFRLQLLHAP